MNPFPLIRVGTMRVIGMPVGRRGRTGSLESRESSLECGCGVTISVEELAEATLGEKDESKRSMTRESSMRKMAGLEALI